MPKKFNTELLSNVWIIPYEYKIVQQKKTRFQVNLTNFTKNLLKFTKFYL